MTDDEKVVFFCASRMVADVCLVGSVPSRTVGWRALPSDRFGSRFCALPAKRAADFAENARDLVET